MHITLKYDFKIDIAESRPNFVTGEHKCDVQEKCSHCAKSDRYYFQMKPLMSKGLGTLI